MDKIFNNSFFNENIIKESEKLPNKIKLSLDKGKLIQNQLNEYKLNSFINDCLNIENNIYEIKKIKENIDKSKSMNLTIIFNPDENEINKILKTIKKLGTLKLDSIFDSKIEFDQNLVKTWLNNKNFIAELLFKKSRDGSTPINFHEKRDNKGITITFIETTKGFKFGGYTEIKWKKNLDVIKDNSTFLFSFNNKEKYTIKNNNGSIGCNNSNDLWFGSGFPEIYFVDSLNRGQSVYSKSSSSFLIGRVLTNGEEFWDVKELEVFKIQYN